MRISLFMLLLSFECICQSSLVLQKKLDSLKFLQSRQEENLKNLRKQIVTTEHQLGLSIVEEPPAEFGRITVTNQEELIFWNNRFNKPKAILYKVPANSQIVIIGYKKDNNDGNDYLQAIHNGKTGFIDAYYLQTDEELNRRIETIKLRDARIENAKKEEKSSKLTNHYIKLGSPLAINSVDLRVSSVSTPEAIVIVSNLSNKTINRYELSISCFDNYNRPVNHPARRSSQFKAVYALELNPGKENIFGNWVLDGYDRATKVTVSLISVRFSDGKIWRPAQPVIMRSN